MPLSSVLPSDFEALLPAKGDDLCALLKKAVKRRELKYRLVKTFFKSDGAFTPEFASALCAVRAACEEA